MKLEQYEYYKTDLGTLYCGDCLEIMPLIEEKVDMILCDLPYGTTACSWDTIIPFDRLWDCYNRLVYDKSAIVLTASQPFTSKLIMSNLSMFRYEWIWEKEQGVGGMLANKMPLKSHENICVFYKNLPIYNPEYEKGKPYTIIRNSSREDSVYGKIGKEKYFSENDGKRYPKSVIKIKRDTDYVHPTQKPIELGRYFVRTYTNKEGIVLDNTSGSGSFLLSAEMEGRRWIGIEISEKYCEIAKKRIQKEASQGKLNL
jgi:site-specific DNA-methyltransferase (adenine-specific)